MSEERIKELQAESTGIQEEVRRTFLATYISPSQQHEAISRFCRHLANQREINALETEATLAAAKAALRRISLREPESRSAWARRLSRQWAKITD